MRDVDGQDRRGVGRKEAIVDAAFAALMADGLPHLSYDRIAREAGVTRQLVRYHFPDPETLMLTLCDHLAAVYRETLIGEIAGCAAEARLDAFLDFYFDLIAGTPKPRDDRAYDALMSLSAGSDRIRRALRGQYTLLGQVVAHEVKQKHPSIPLPACEEIAYQFVIVMYGHWKMVATLGLHPSHNRVARDALRRIIASHVEDPSVQADVARWKEAE